MSHLHARVDAIRKRGIRLPGHLSPVGWAVVVVVLLGLVLILLRPDAEGPEDTEPRQSPEPTSQLADLRFPTEQTGLLGPVTVEVFQPTSSGRLMSGTYGSVRTDSRNRPRFHEGIDIAPLNVDRRGTATDPVVAVADGKVAYCNRSVGASNYGKYVVLVHEDPVGTVYSLYAHLASVSTELAPGQRIARGAAIGIMGASSNIRERFKPHVHFEIGLISNAHFARIVKSTHGIYNGMNLLGMSPTDIFAAHRDAESFNMLGYLRAAPVAFRLVVASNRHPDFFERHPALWVGSRASAPAIVLECADVGIPLSGRNANPEELRRLGAEKVLVLDADAEILGANGRALVRQDKAGWTLGRNGSTWLKRLLYHPPEA